jgi:hypothetical protein
MGEVAVRKLVDLMEGIATTPSKTVLFTELILRQSSGTARHALTASGVEKE